MKTASAVLALVPSLLVAACGARSALDDYADGVPDIIPSPIVQASDGGSDGASGPAIGDPCEDDDDCAKGATCIDEVNLGFKASLPGGYCTQSCSKDGDCPDGAGCEQLLDTCLKSCTKTSQCREDEGYECNPSVVDESESYCTPSN